MTVKPDRADGDILENQYANQVATFRRFDLAGFVEDFQHDRGVDRRYAEQGVGERGNRDGRQADLQETEDEHLARHFLELREGKFQPDGEHQEDDPEFRNMVQRFAAARVHFQHGGQNGAGDDVTDHGGNTGPAQQHV